MVTRRGLRRVKLLISDAHEGFKAAIARCSRRAGDAAACTSCATRWHRPIRANARLAGRDQHDPRSGYAGGGQRSVAHCHRPVAPQEHDVLACMALPSAQRVQLRSTNPLERLNAEVKRVTNFVSIFRSERAIIRLVGVMMLDRTTNGPCGDPIAIKSRSARRALALFPIYPLRHSYRNWRRWNKTELGIQVTRLPVSDQANVRFGRCAFF